MTERYAAIDLDEMMDRPFAELNAVEFLQVLNHPKLDLDHATILSDKKKYELWTDEGVIGTIPLRDVIGKLRGEKKKLEYEIQPGLKPFPPEDGLRNLDYGRLVEDIAGQVATKLGRS